MIYNITRVIVSNRFSRGGGLSLIQSTSQAATAICRSADSLSTIYVLLLYILKDHRMRINVHLQGCALIPLCAHTVTLCMVCKFSHW